MTVCVRKGVSSLFSWIVCSVIAADELQSDGVIAIIFFDKFVFAYIPTRGYNCISLMNIRVN